jgi:hypothetical protein
MARLNSKLARSKPAHEDADNYMMTLSTQRDYKPEDSPRKNDDRNILETMYKKYLMIKNRKPAEKLCNPAWGRQPVDSEKNSGFGAGGLDLASEKLDTTIEYVNQLGAIRMNDMSMNASSVGDRTFVSNKGGSSLEDSGVYKMQFSNRDKDDPEAPDLDKFVFFHK